MKRTGRTRAGRRAAVEPLERRAMLAAHLVADLNTLPASVSEDTSAAFAYAGSLYFPATDEVHGTELWRTDAAAAGGERLVADLFPGSTSSGPTGLTVAGGHLFFSALTSGGAGLFVTDGTAAGTRAVTAPGQATGTEPLTTFALGSAVVAYAPSSQQLFRSDGTAAGTTDYAAGSAYPVASAVGTHGFLSPTAFGGAIYYADAEASGPTELWRTDGTTAGTYRVASLEVGGNGPTLTSDGGRLYVDDGAGGLYVTDGTAAGTTKLVDPTVAGGADVGTSLGVVNGKYLFVTRQTVFGQSPVYLYASDGTVAGTARVTAVDPTESFIGTASTTDTAVAGGRAYAVVFATSLGQAKLWSTDGTAAGTGTLIDPDPAGGGLSSSDPAVVAYDGRAYFVATDGTHGPVVYGSDGTAAGTAPATPYPATPAPGPLNGSAGPFPVGLGVAGGNLYFARDASSGGRQVFVTDGTPAGTAQVTSYDDGTSDSSPTPLAAYNGSLLFQAAGSGVYDTAGTAATTTVILPFVTGAVVPSATYDGRSYVIRTDRHLIRTDGTAAGTVDTGATVPGSPQTVLAAGDYSPGVVANGLLYFAGGGSSGGGTLIRTDGTAAGTYPVYAGTTAAPPVAAGGVTYFAASYYVGTSYSTGLFRTDGTAAGTVLLNGSVNPANLVAYNGRLYFYDRNSNATWTSDGTAAGTVRVTAAGGYLAPTAIQIGGRLLLRMGGNALYLFDGTDAGKAFVDLGFGTGVHSVGDGPYGGFLAGLGGGLLFTDKGYNLYDTDGTAAGTHLLRSFVLATGGPSSLGAAAVTSAGLAYFTADDGVHGRELWQTDGTAAGTRPAADVYPGATSSTPSDPVAVGDSVYFAATDPAHGRELWEATPDPLATVAGDTVTIDSAAAGGGAFTVAVGFDDVTVLRGSQQTTLPLAGGGVPAIVLTDATAATSLTVVAAAAATLSLTNDPGPVSLDVEGYVSLVKPAAGPVVLASLVVNPSKFLDLGTADVVVGNGSLAALYPEVAAGYGNGTGSANYGIKTTATAAGRRLTVGINTGDAVGGTFDGVAVAASDVILKPTAPGDVNLDGVIDGRDYVRVDAGFSLHLTGWANGDFNYDGRVDGSDYTLIDNAFILSHPKAAVAPAAAEVAGAAIVVRTTPAKSVPAVPFTARPTAVPATPFSPTPFSPTPAGRSVDELLDETRRRRA